ncbi:holo-[acyl-carrier-protein] synthase [Prosthecochloris sp. ZM_2]|uniref:holo-ACP synthase n=1 Tax=Prosthecochloris sp. ZM_2 TaxID=2045206 RepID=UPI000DF7B4F1|nr:holo-ACP synthase [Prosthecochloris sp. ZM_2]RNA64166.1 holo-[acyl-carrier-protein] synthase [Prosthecochloris sp. ZM_2]
MSGVDNHGGREVGVDIVDVTRIRSSYERYGEKFLRRVLTDREIEACREKGDMLASVAARFAAKEAVSKALGTGLSRGFSWKSVEILNESSGRPVVHVLDSSLGVQSSAFRISLSHDGPFAVAFVMLEG